jgi:hypothetical protein
MLSRHSPTQDFDRLRGAIADGFETSSALIVSEVKDRLDIPVDYGIGPRGGTYVIRSQPGEPPRRETGRLQEGIDGEATIEGDVIELVIGSDTFYAPFLDPKLQRLIFTDVAEEFLDVVIDNIVTSIQQTFTE